MYGYIYKTTNLINNKIYIGQHKGNTYNLKYFGSGKLISQAIAKYGIENFTIDILDTAESLEELNYKEYLNIDLYKSSVEYGNYNLLTNNEKGIFKHNESSKLDISNTLKNNYKTGKMTPYWTGKHLTKEMINKLDVTGYKWYNNGKDTIYLKPSEEVPEGFYPGRLGHYGHPMSEETRKKLSNKAKGHKVSRETREKISKQLKGKKHKISENQHNHYSKNATERNLGRHWYNNGIIRVFAKECPDGFVQGYKLSK